MYKAIIPCSRALQFKNKILPLTTVPCSYCVIFLPPSPQPNMWKVRQWFLPPLPTLHPLSPSRFSRFIPAFHCDCAPIHRDLDGLHSACSSCLLGVSDVTFSRILLTPRALLITLSLYMTSKRLSVGGHGPESHCHLCCITPLPPQSYSTLHLEDLLYGGGPTLVSPPWPLLGIPLSYKQASGWCLQPGVFLHFFPKLTSPFCFTQ